MATLMRRSPTSRRYAYDYPDYQPPTKKKVYVWHTNPKIRAALLAGEPVPYEEGELEAAEATKDMPPANRKYTHRQRFEFMRQLASYFEAEIDVYAEMCLDRSYNSIEALATPKSPIPGEGGRGFSYDMLLALMIDTRLPDQIRASYVHHLFLSPTLTLSMALNPPNRNL